MDQTIVGHLFCEARLTDYRWISPARIVIEQWVRFKCTWGCKHYGRRANCPPNQPSIAECERFVRGYTVAAVFHFSRAIRTDDEELEWLRQLNDMLYEAERKVFLSGFYKAFALYPGNCSLCQVCATTKAECSNRIKSRPGADSLGIDVFQTVRSVGFPIESWPSAERLSTDTALS